MRTESQQQWRYLAEDRAGALVSGALSAISIDGALKALDARGLKPISIDAASNGRAPSIVFASWRTGVSTADLSIFCARMADLLKGGVPAARALGLIAAQEGRQSVKKFAERLAASLRKGESLSAALAQDPGSPPRQMIALVAAGEALGMLGAQFEQLRRSFEARAALGREIVSQLIYPAALFFLLALTLVFLSFFVLPQFESVFATAGATPPAETRFVLAAGTVVRDYWMVGVGTLAASLLALRVLAARHPVGVERLVLRLPIIGRAIATLETARYCRGLGELLAGATPLAKAMPIACAAVSNSVLREEFSAIEADVRRGAPLSRAAQGIRSIRRDAIAFIELGEETGELGPMTVKAAEHLEVEMTEALKRASALAGPAITALMGALTAGVIAAVMTGVLSLNDAVY